MVFNCLEMHAGTVWSDISVIKTNIQYGGRFTREERDQRTPSVERPCWSPAFTAFRTVLACLENRLGVVHILLCSLEMLKKNRPSLQVSCRLLVAESLLEAVDSFGMAAVDLS